MNEELQTVNAQLITKVEDLDRTNSDLRNLFESTQVATIFLDRHLVVRSFTPAVAGIYNLIPGDHGRPITDIASQLEYADLRRDVRQVLETLQTMERRVTRIDHAAYYLMRILPYRAVDDTVDGALITFVDVTGIVQAEQHHRLLVDELNHRVRNMLTVVISLATQTLRGSSTLEEFSPAFLGRLHALAGTYALLTRVNWQAVPLYDVMLEEMRPHMAEDGNNIDIAGPLIALTPRAALAMGMTVHELTTNAHKFGALSRPGGQVSVKWRLDETAEQPILHWEWRERGGPAVSAPTARGFGSKLIERTVGHELNGHADISYPSDGIEVTLRIPLHPKTISRAAAVQAPP